MTCDDPPALAPESWPQSLLTRMGAALDWLMLHGMRLAFDEVLVPATGEIERLRGCAAPYQTPALAADPAGFFAALRDPAPPPDVTSARAGALPGGTVWQHRFASGYVPFHRRDGGDPDGDAANEVVHVTHWRRDGDAPRPTVVAVHGFTMGQPTIDAHVLMARTWYRWGFDVALPALPHHGARAAASDRYSGRRFCTWDVGQFNESVRQSVHDLGRLRAWLGTTGHGPVGVAGLSLGGYVTALAAELFDDLAFAIPIAAPACAAALPSLLFGTTRVARRGALPPLDVSALRRAFLVHSPLVHPLRTPRERVMLVAGRGDAIVPPEHAWRLWRHWGEPTLHWFSGGHVAPFQREAIMRAVHGHLARLGLVAAPIGLPVRGALFSRECGVDDGVRSA